MTRGLLIGFGVIWLFAAGVVIAAVAGSVADLSRAYATAWLLLVSLPLGALPVLMMLDLAGAGDTDVTAALRLLLGSLPILAVLIVPLLLQGRFLYALGGSAEGFAASWWAPGFFAGRAIAYLLIWIVLSAFFVRREPPRRSIAGFGLLLHLVVGTLAAYDWFMALDAGFVSSAYGILVIVTQCAFALTAAAVIARSTRGHAGPDRTLVIVLLILVGAASFVQFAQYLVVWSANLPKEIVWYQTRAGGGLGPAFAILAPILLGLAVIVLLPERLGMRRVPMTLALAAILVVEVADIVLLASPGVTAIRLLLDVPFIVALAGIAACCAVLVTGRRNHRVPHG